MADVNPIPEDYPQLTAYLIVDGADEAIDFYTKVFGARERMRIPAPEDKVGHAELEIDRGLLMLADEFPEMGIRGPKAYGGSAVIVNLYVEDVDATFEAALQAGAKEVRAPKTEFYGDRSARFEDPFGHAWSISTHVEDVTPEEMARRAEATP